MTEAKDGSPHAYIPNTEANRQAMLEVIGAESVDGLFAEIPQSKRDPQLDLPKALSEVELRRLIRSVFRKNITTEDMPSFLGAGATRHSVPSVVPATIMRSEFATSYTPYQAEISQGTLQSAFEFQTMVCILTGMEVTNTGMYDGASAFAEAALMASRITGRQKVVILDSTHPNATEVVETYAQGKDLKVEKVGNSDFDRIDQETAAVLVPSPNYFGYLEDLAKWAEVARQSAAKFVVYVDNPLSLGLFKPPGEFGADIVAGEIASLGNPLNFGGPNCGILASKMEFVRNMPGRIVGKTTDDQGQVGYVLTLQTREQHIRRESATSNICTSEALVALASTIYLALVGPQLRELAKINYHKAHYAADQISQIPGFQLPLTGIFFNEFVVECPIAPSIVNQKLLEAGIIGGLDISHQIKNGILLSFTEMNTREEIDQFVSELRKVPASGY